MVSKQSLDDRLSRIEAIEAIEAREADATEGQYSIKILRQWSLPDLLRLEGLLERAETGEPTAVLSAAEQEWIDETMKQAKVIADAPRDLAKRLLELEIASASETTGGRKFDLGWLTKEERNRLRVILMRVKDLPKYKKRIDALTTAEVAWLTELGARQPG